MKRESVDSGHLKSVGYDDSQQELEIEFKGGEVYRYSGVPNTIYHSLIRAESKGKHFHRFIRNVFPYRRAQQE